MELFVYLVLPIAGSVFILAAQIYGMIQIGTDRRLGRGARAAAAAIYIAAAVILIIFAPPNWKLAANLLVFAGLPVLGNRICHSGRKYFVYYLLLDAAVYLTDALVITAIQTMAASGFLYLNSMELFNLLVICAVRLAEYMVIRFVVCLVRKNNGQEITGKQLMVSFVLPVFSLLNLYVMLYFLQVYLTEGMLVLFLANLAGLVGLNIYFAVLTDTMSEKERLKKELALSRQQASLQCAYYEQEEKKYEESRKILHDIRSHILAMEQLYQERDAGKAAEYAGEITDMLNSLGQMYYTSEKILNIILNDKVRQMKRHNIIPDIRIGEVDLSFMQDVDITALFANLLDNAVAAAGMAAGNDQEARIRLRVEPLRQFLSIRMENTCREQPERDGGYFKSGKAHHEGLGLKSISRVAERYGGDVQYEWEDGIFKTRILLVRERGEDE